MKKLIIGALVGGLLLFFWQFLSNTILDLHRPMQDYTPKQTEILNYLNENLDEGFYYLPTAPAGTSAEENEKHMNEAIGKPWAQVYFHKAMNMSMPMNMLRGVIINILMVLLIGWVLLKMGKSSFQDIFLSCVVVGLVVYLNSSYTYSIWYQTKTMPDLIEYLVSWGLVGAWLGWWLNRN